jgi:hypothetical protein
VTDKQVKTLDAKKAAEMDSANLDLAKQDFVIRTKQEAAERIADTDWKVERTKERDALNSTNTVQDIYAERELIRGLSDEVEKAVTAMKGMEDISGFSW